MSKVKFMDFRACMCTQVSCNEISYFMYGQIWSMFPFHSNFIKVSCLVADIRHYVISLFCSGWQWLIVNDLMAKGARAICLFTRMFSGNFERIIDFGKSISGAFQCFSLLNIIAYKKNPSSFLLIKWLLKRLLLSSKSTSMTKGFVNKIVVLT